MTEHPILFSSPMVRAILDGRKTQTRRAIWPQPDWEDSWSGTTMSWPGNILDGKRAWRCPYGYPGHRLWVRETWANAPKGVTVAPHVDYLADWPDGELPGKRVRDIWPCDNRWRPSIHMPRWACRITLTVTAVRVERLRDISEEDAQAEGVQYRDDTKEMCRGYLSVDETVLYDTAKRAFQDLWDSINGAKPGRSWSANPWVWAVAFTLHGKETDQ